MNKKQVTKEWVSYIENIVEVIYDSLKSFNIDEADIVKENIILIFYSTFVDFFFKGDFLTNDSIIFAVHHSEYLQLIIDICRDNEHYILLFETFYVFYNSLLMECEALERYEAANNIKLIWTSFYNQLKINDLDFLLQNLYE